MPRLDPERGPVLRIGLTLGLCLLFVRVSMIHEIITAETGINTRLLYIVGIPFLLLIPGSGAWGRTFHRTQNWAWLGFIVCMLVATPFSTWVGGSAMHTLYYLRTTAPLLLATAGFATRWEDCRLIMKTVAAAGVVNVLSSRLFAYQDSIGRNSLEFGTIANANDLAAHLLLVLPFLFYIVMGKNSWAITKIAAAAAIAWGLYSILATGSRGALVGLAVMSLVAFWKGTAAQRVGFSAAAAVSAIALLAVLPGPTLNRLGSFSSASTASGEALASEQTRAYLSYQSMQMTLRHPLTGVGPGQFSNVMGQLSKAEGLHVWQETHNFFTQISSECGIPALIFYLIAVVSAVLATNRVNRRALARPELSPELSDVRTMTYCLLLSMTGFGVASLFLNLAYQYYWLTLAGLATSIVRISRPMYVPDSSVPGSR